MTENEYKHESNTEITNHPLYQQTIKDVLSDEAFARYKALQAERQAFRLQATSDLVVASLDTHLLLDKNQRQHFEDTVAQLPTSTNIFTKLFEQLDNSEVLNSWQQARLDEFKWFAKDKEGWLGQDKKKEGKALEVSYELSEQNTLLFSLTNLILRTLQLTGTSDSS